MNLTFLSATLELLSCQFSAKTIKSGQFSIKPYEKVRVVACSFYSYYDKFLGEIPNVQSLKALSMQDYLPANVLKCRSCD